MLLVAAVVGVWPFTTGADLENQIATAVLNVVIVLAAWSLISGTAHRVVRPQDAAPRTDRYVGRVMTFQQRAQPSTTTPAVSRFASSPSPPVEIVGDTVAARRDLRDAQSTRSTGSDALLCLEPRGHADMYGGFLTPPDDDGAAFGVLFWHKDGFSTACGHGTIALGVWAVADRARRRRRRRRDRGADRRTVGSCASRGCTPRTAATSLRSTSSTSPATRSTPTSRSTTSRGRVRVDIGFGGATYAQVRASDLGSAGRTRCASGS